MKILIRLPNWLGDVVMSTAFVYAVRQLYSGSQIDVIIKKELGGLTSFIEGINQVHLFPKQEHKGLQGVYRYGKSLRNQNYDLFFCLPDSLSSAVMGWGTRAKKRVGFSKEGRFFLLTNSYKKPTGLHRVDEYVSLLEQFSGGEIPDKSVKLQAKTKQVSPGKILLNFNSEAVSRRMPQDKGRQLIHALLNSFDDAHFITVGSSKEKEYVDSLLNEEGATNRIENYAGKTDLEGLSELIASSSAVLTTDSGPAHLANALGIPTIVLFGAGNELNTAPYNKNFLTVIRAGKLACEPCVQNTCKLYGVPKCMQLLNEIEIINALRLYLNHA